MSKIFQGEMALCVNCLSRRYKRQIAGADRSWRIVQCEDCGFNVSGQSWDEAEAKWNGFKVWELLDDAYNFIGQRVMQS